MHTSVIVVSHNSCRDLAACLTAISAQLADNDEVIVVDCGSSDGSADLVAEHFPAVRLLRGPNRGYAGGNNSGAAIARGAYLVFLNPDTIAHPGAVAALVAPLAANQHLGMTTACLVHVGRPDIVNACGNTMHYTGLTYCRGAGRPRSAYTIPATVSAVSGAAFAIRREQFLALGGFDEHFFMYVEDSDLSWRMRLSGYTIRYIPEAVIEHHYRMTYNPNKAFYLERNRYLMLLKNLGQEMLWRMLPALLLSEVVTGGYLLLRGPRYWGVKLRAYGWLWRNRAAIRATRRATQALRRRPDTVILAETTEHLEFEQLASRPLAALAKLIFHPAFRLAHPLRGEGRP